MQCAWRLGGKRALLGLCSIKTNERGETLEGTDLGKDGGQFEEREEPRQIRRLGVSEDSPTGPKSVEMWYVGRRIFTESSLSESSLKCNMWKRGMERGEYSPRWLSRVFQKQITILGWSWKLH